MAGPSQFDMALNEEERAVLRGEHGEALRKAMECVVRYGAAFEARGLVAIQGSPHLVTSSGPGVIKPYLEMMDELVAAGLRTTAPFTVNPRPSDRENISYSWLEKIVIKFFLGNQKTYESKLARLGLRDGNAFTCTCYLPEVGNVPGEGDVLAWSESSAVVFANSVLGARTNRNSAGIDLLCNIVGKAPLFGLLTDEGRRATWLVEVRTSTLPNAQLLGSAIGMRVVEGVPYIIGLDRFLGRGLDETAVGYLKDMGASAASNGAVGLYHVENVTPEAVRMGRDLLADGHGTYVVDDAGLERAMRSYPVLWKRKDASPRLCIIGCPHLTSQQLRRWAGRILDALGEAGRSSVAVDTFICAAPDVLERFALSAPEHRRIVEAGVRLTSICPLIYMSNPFTASRPVVTNSNKLRTYSTARFFPDEQVLHAVVSGRLEGEARGETQ
ncbi:MAG: aconitase X [Planctomycetota bacterium]|jgi:predicted aconitase